MNDWYAKWTVGAGLLILAGAAGCGSSPSTARAAGPSPVADAGSPAAGDLPATTQCTVVPQGGCPPNHTCAVAGSSDETSCYGAGVIATGQACEEEFDCAAGDLCYGGACMPICTAGSDCAGAGSRCLQAYDENNQAIAGYETCSAQCNPADPSNQAQSASFSACGPGLACDEAGDVEGATVCETAGSAGAGASCRSGDCAPSLVCLFPTAQAASGTCTPLCLMGGASACNSGSCQRFDIEVYVTTPAGTTEVGFCG